MKDTFLGSGCRDDLNNDVRTGFPWPSSGLSHDYKEREGQRYTVREQKMQKFVCDLELRY